MFASRRVDRTPAVRMFAWLLAAAAMLLSAGPAAARFTPPAANGSATAATATPTPAEAATQRRAEVIAELERVRGQIAATGEQTPPALQRDEELLERIELLLDQQLAALQERQESEGRLAEIAKDLAELEANGPIEAPPYSVLRLDSIRDELAGLRSRIETGAIGINAATAAKEQAEQAFEKSEAARRRAREAKEKNTDDANASTLARALREAQLESRIASEQLALRTIEVQRQQHLKDLLEIRIRLLEERERWISKATVFTPEDYRVQTVELEARERQLRQRLELVQTRTAHAEREWFDAKRRLQDNPADGVALAEEVAARRQEVQVRQREVGLLTKRLERLAGEKTIWQRRYEVSHASRDRAPLSAWDAETRALLEVLDTEYRLQEFDLRDLRRDVVTLQARLDRDDTEPTAAASWIRREVELLGKLDELFEANAASLDSAQRLAKRLLGDIGNEIATISIGERVDRLLASLKSVWRFEITSVDDRPITVGKIVIAVVLLFVGFFASRLMSGWLGKRLLPRFGLNEGAVAAIRSVVFYLLLVSFVLIALRVAAVPLTAFTILGGALAIGVGFGSQNIMNNFMSGLILLAERPIRVGDLIQLGELYGIVQHIGARSTRVRTGSNVEIVVPNSSFLENNVINWTLSETNVRVHVSVGVVYGVPTRDVAKLLMRAVQEHGRVLKNPNPTVLFTEFGDNSLNFEVHFWIKMRTTMDRRTIESDVRYRIDHLFREARIVIAFPQRDVHLDTMRPLEVRMVSDEPADGAGNDG